MPPFPICTQMKTWIAATVLLALGGAGLFWLGTIRAAQLSRVVSSRCRRP